MVLNYADVLNTQIVACHPILIVSSICFLAIEHEHIYWDLIKSFASIQMGIQCSYCSCAKSMKQKRQAGSSLRHTPLQK